MRIVKIDSLSTGRCVGMTLSRLITLRDGWAIIPDDIVTQNYPYGVGEVSEVEGVMTLVSWTPGEMPEPIPEPEPEPTADELIDILLGVSANE